MFSNKNQKVHELIMEQFANVKSVLFTFEDFLRVACSEESDMDVLRELSNKIFEQEAEADRSLRRMIDSLGNAAYLPSTREELISIGTKCDRIANKCETVCRMVVLQQFRFPSEYHADLQEILTITHKQFKTLENSISAVFSRFNEMLKDHSILHDIRVLESAVDAIEHKLLEDTYNRDMGLAEKQQLAKFVSLVCDISDIIEDVSDTILIMLVTRKA
ncbi:MAG: DUF47 family protein [Tyzzerella sp.]|nr:DUF47 family protein [Tyzzerella sp.]